MVRHMDRLAGKGRRKEGRMSADLEEQYDKIYRYCYMKLGHRQTAEDITQETFLRFLADHRYQDMGRELAYLYTIARNQCIDYYRKQKPLTLSEEVPLENGEERLLTSLALQKAVGRLSEEEQELIFLKYVNELTAAEISRILGWSRYAVYRRLKACLKKLKENLGKEEFF